MKNITNIALVLDHIKKHKDHFDQAINHTKITHSFAGWAEMFATGENYTFDEKKTRRIARIYLGFTWREADYYFDPERTLSELETALDPFYDKEGFGQDGYDKDGFDFFGHNIYGYDRQENDNQYDEDGYDEDGYDRWGYDREGYDRDGLTRGNFPKEIFMYDDEEEDDDDEN